MARISGFNLMILTETKITDQAYCRKGMGYDVVCLKVLMTADRDAKGVVGMII